MVALLAALGLLFAVGVTVMVLFWLQTEGGELLPAQRHRAWEALGVLYTAARSIIGLFLAAVTVWTFLVVANIRTASGVQRHPAVAALSWPLIAVGMWGVAERFIVDQEMLSVVAGHAMQAGLLLIPFFLLERAAGAVLANCQSVRVTYLCFVVLLVAMQTFGPMTQLEDPAGSDIGPVVVCLALGAVLQLVSTLAVRDMCRSIDAATGRVAHAHNVLILGR